MATQESFPRRFFEAEEVPFEDDWSKRIFRLLVFLWDFLVFLFGFGWFFSRVSFGIFLRFLNDFVILLFCFLVCVFLYLWPYLRAI